MAEYLAMSDRDYFYIEAVSLKEAIRMTEVEVLDRSTWGVDRNADREQPNIVSVYNGTFRLIAVYTVTRAPINYPAMAGEISRHLSTEGVPARTVKAKVPFVRVTVGEQTVELIGRFMGRQVPLDDEKAILTVRGPLGAKSFYSMHHAMVEVTRQYKSLVPATVSAIA